jgi:hypothetical protein
VARGCHRNRKILSSTKARAFRAPVGIGENRLLCDASKFRRRAIFPMKTNIPLLSTLTILAALSTAWAQSPAIVPLLDVESGYLLGGSRGGKWLKPPATATALKSGGTMRVFSANRALGTARTTPPKSEGAPCDETLWSKTSPNFANQNAQFALGGTHNPLPRKVQVENTDQTTYRNVVASVLKSRGIARPVVQITQIWRVDLDGDATQEVLISATRKADYGDKNSIAAASRAGDYSLILLRKIVRGKVQNILIAGQFHPQKKEFNAPGFYRLGAVLDADGDGIMEILVRGRYYEGLWTSLYSVQTAQPREVLVEGCGA